MNDHITKPISPDHLMSVLAKWVHVPEHRNSALPSALSPSLSNATPAQDLPQELLALSSLDAREGIQRIGGKIDAYRRQLRRFREHYPEAITELRRLASEQGIQQAEEYCHALKGVTGNIGAHALYEKIAAINNQLKQGVLPGTATLDEANALLQQLMSEIDIISAHAEPPAPPASEPLDAESLRALLARLSYALEFDMGAVEPLLAELRAGVTHTPWETQVASIAALADGFDIDTALAQLKQLEASLPETTPGEPGQ